MKRYTQEEIDMIMSDLPTKEIMRRTGRSYYAIASKRNKLRHPGRYIYKKPLDSDIGIIRYGVCIPPGDTLTQEEKEERLYSLASKLDIKLYRGNGIYGTKSEQRQEV